MKKIVIANWKCFPETKQEAQTILKQLNPSCKGLKDFGPKEMVNLCIAYEPVWAIGSGKPCSSEDAKNMATYIKGLMYEVFGAKEFPVIYGGSVNSGNAKDYVTNGNMDGLLVGRASLDWQEFVNIILSIEKNKA